MNATNTFRPSASSPASVFGPSAMTWPPGDSLTLTNDRLLVNAGSGIRSHELAQLINVHAFVRPAHQFLLRLRRFSVLCDNNLFRCDRNNDHRPPSATMTAFESRATFPSSPVPTSGDSDRISGTPCRCMLEPISARFASSCSRKGISPAATETSCFGEISM